MALAHPSLKPIRRFGRSLWDAKGSRLITPRAMVNSWPARVPGRDLILPMLQMTTLADGVAWDSDLLADPDVLAACTTSMWAWSDAGRSAAERIAWEVALLGAAQVMPDDAILIDIGLCHSIDVRGT